MSDGVCFTSGRTVELVRHFFCRVGRMLLHDRPVTCRDLALPPFALCGGRRPFITQFHCPACGPHTTANGSGPEVVLKYQ